MPHIHDLIDFTVVAYIVHDNKVLLIDHKKYHTWLPIGGHVELNEDPEQALYREVEEEAGYKGDEIEVWGEVPKIEQPDMRPLPAPVFMDSHDTSETHKHIGMVYFVKAKHGKVRLEQREHNNIKWFTKEELSGAEYNLKPWIQYCAREALETIGNHAS